MLDMEELVGSLDEFRTLDSHNNNYLSENDVFDEITQLVTTTTTTTSDVNGGPMVGYPNEWKTSFGDEREAGGGGSIAERRAMTCGFGGFIGPTINVAQFRSSVSPLASPAGRSSPYITIPAGISPTELLDSPVMLRYSQAQPSPTTGSFQLPPLNRETVALDSKGFELPVKFPSYLRNPDTELSADFEDSKDMIGRLTSQSEGDQQGALLSSELNKTFEDGYNWRKYGQKQVKGSEFPRSYYKCTHPNCLVKKKVERSLDGDMAEIIYKGSHNHPPPQPNSRSNVGGSFSANGEVNEPCQEEREGGGIVWRNIQPRVDSKNVLSENLDPFSMAQMKSSGGYEVAGAQESSCKLVCHDEDEGKSLEDDAYLDESESKRRKIDLPFPETHVVSRGVREPRVVVQIESEVDNLDDGYRWRKYGQKVVKGNPNPRSYYKCTSPGCPVRKHVERACDDFKFVVTAYEGKHDHEVPVAKTATVSSSSLFPASTHPAYTNVAKAEPQMQDLSRRFEKIPDLGNDFMRSALLGNLANNIYPLHFPHLQNSTAYSYNAGMSNFPMSLLYDVPRTPMMMPGGVNQYNMAAPVQSSVVGKQPMEIDSGLIKPKQENL